MTHPDSTAYSGDPTWVDLGPSRSGRDINDGPVYAPDGTFACGDPDCYSCWPEGAPNTVAYSAGAVCCPDEASARRHPDRATWWEPSRLIETATNGMTFGPGRMTLTWLPGERRWT